MTPSPYPLHHPIPASSHPRGVPPFILSPHRERKDQRQDCHEELEEAAVAAAVAPASPSASPAPVVVRVTAAGPMTLCGGVDV